MKKITSILLLYFLIIPGVVFSAPTTDLKEYVKIPTISKFLSRYTKEGQYIDRQKRSDPSLRFMTILSEIIAVRKAISICQDSNFSNFVYFDSKGIPRLTRSGLDPDEAKRYDEQHSIFKKNAEVANKLYDIKNNLMVMLKESYASMSDEYKNVAGEIIANLQE